MKKITKSKSKSKKPKYQYGTPSLQDQQVEGGVNAAIGAVGAINPIIGAGLKLGQGVGKMTQNQDGLYKSKVGEFFDNSFNPTTGVAGLVDTAKDFNASTVANKLSLGLVGTSATQKRRQKERQARENAINAQWVGQNTQTDPTLPTFKYGGKRKTSVPSNLSPISGGTVEPVSKDAVQVKAFSPSRTDSVELQDAFVDHNEIIDSENRVFSDSIKTPSGRSVAAEAKRLEKMKNNNSRFQDANSLIDAKLDNLFSYQQRLNLAKASKGSKSGLAVGGLLGDPTKPNSNLVNDPNDDLNPNNLKLWVKSYRDANRIPQNQVGFPGNPEVWSQVNNQVFPTTTALPKPMMGADIDPRTGLADYRLKGEKLYEKSRFDHGGKLFSEADLAPSVDGSLVTGLVQGSGSDAPMPSKPRVPGKGFNWRNAGTMAATFGPDLFNAFLTSQTKGPAAPRTERNIFLDRINANDRLAENARNTANSNQLLRSSISQPGQLTAAVGSTLAKRLYADNAVRGDVSRANAQIQAQEAGLNSQINARNTERQNQFQQDRVNFQNSKLSGYSQIGANIGNKALQLGRERNLKELSMVELGILKEKYKDSGLDTRFIDNAMDDYLSKQRLNKPKKKLGGKIRFVNWINP